MQNGPSKFSGALWWRGGACWQADTQVVVIPYFLEYSQPEPIISFLASKGGDYSREATISNIAHCESCSKYFVLLSQQIKTFSHQNKLNMGFLSQGVPNLVPWLIFRAVEEGAVGIFDFGHFLGRFFGFCTEKLRIFGFDVRWSFWFSGFLASGFLAKIKHVIDFSVLWVCAVRCYSGYFYVSILQSIRVNSCIWGFWIFVWGLQ